MRQSSIDVSIEVRAVLPGNQYLACAQVLEAAITGAVHILGVVNLPAQPVTYGQLSPDSPGVLGIGKETILPLGRARGIANVPRERLHLAQKKRRQEQSPSAGTDRKSTRLNSSHQII